MPMDKVLADTDTYCCGYFQNSLGLTGCLRSQTAHKPKMLTTWPFTEKAVTSAIEACDRQVLAEL